MGHLKVVSELQRQFEFQLYSGAWSGRVIKNNNKKKISNFIVCCTKVAVRKDAELPAAAAHKPNGPNI